MRKVAYDEQPKSTGNTENHLAVDEAMKEDYSPQQMEEGFAASDGVRGQTAETGGRVKHPEKGDRAFPESVPTTIDDENPGLADN